MSENAVNDIPNDIDFLYIDGNHQYEYVLQDLTLYYPKVKKNCYIIGDDACDINENNRDINGNIYFEFCKEAYGYFGVIKAFRDFINQNNIITSYINDGQYLIKK